MDKASDEQRRRLHDLKGAVRTLKLAVKAIQDGYRFDDQAAPAKIAAMAKAVEVLEREAEGIIKALEAP